MDKLNPETLMAYLDGELSQDEKVAVKKLLADDDEAAAQVRRFAENESLLRAELLAVLDTPVPHYLVDGVRHDQPAGEIEPLPVRRRQSLRGLIWPKLALATGVALIIGVFVGQGLFHEATAPTPFAANSFLQDTLETQPMGTVSVDGGTGETVVPINTLLTDDGQVCREYERQIQEQRLIGVACRDDNGQWQPLLKINTSLLAKTPRTGSEYVPAEGSADPLNAALTVLGVEKGLTTTEEQQLMKRGWR